MGQLTQITATQSQRKPRIGIKLKIARKTEEEEVFVLLLLVKLYTQLFSSEMEEGGKNLKAGSEAAITVLKV